MKDTILCEDKDAAKDAIDNIGGKYIDDFEYLPGGEIRIFLNCSIKDICEQREKSE